MQYDIEIDKNNLDEEAIYIPAAFDAFQMKEAEAQEDLELLRDRLKVLQADISLEIRGWTIEKINSFFGYNLTSLKEEVYKQLVFVHPKVIDLYNQIANTRRDLFIYQAARKSIEKKSSNMELLGRLHGQGYFIRVEGRSYKKLALDTMIDKLKRQTIQRLKEEEIQKKAPKAYSGEAGAVVKTLKTPKPQGGGSGERIERVR